MSRDYIPCLALGRPLFIPTMASETLETPLTKLLNIQHPVILAGMNAIATPQLAAAVSNAGGLGVIGGVGYKPYQLQQQIDELKELLHDKTCFGVDLLLPKVGDGARVTNYDYTKGTLPDLIDIIAKSGARLFVCAVGVPPKWAVDKLHAAGVACANMIGHPKHVAKAVETGADIMIAQGYEAGGHTGDVATMVLIPQCVDACRGLKSVFFGGPVHVVAAGGMVDGRSMGAALSLGAEAVWVGTRFIACEEAGGSKYLREELLKAGPTDTDRKLIWTGRPLRSLRNEYAKKWESDEAIIEVSRLTKQGKLPYEEDMKKAEENGEPWSVAKNFINPLGQCCGSIDSVLSAREIVHGMVDGCIEILHTRSAAIKPLASKL